MANNHDGALEHGVEIVKAIRKVCDDFDFRFAFKLQFRDLDTFIHPDYRDRADYKYVKRFTETRLQWEQFARLREAFAQHGFLGVCTPFDEASVARVEQLGFDVLKIASCSFGDWPLLERVASSKLPIIASTAGASLKDADNVVSFFKHRARPLALMHCVAAYPTETAALQLNQIDLLRARYPEHTIGYSTHEAPSDTHAIGLAIAKGARIFEKHVGLPGDGHVLNAYSASPDQVRAWLEAARKAYSACGLSGERAQMNAGEQKALHGLRRGVWAQGPVPAGQRVGARDTLLAIPLQEGQVSANELSKYLELRPKRALVPGEPLLWKDLETTDVRQRVYEIVRDVRALLAKSGVRVPGEADLEISHHYGIERFAEFGTTLITVINREYCKKLIISLPGQVHPEQFHKKKEETFHVLFGTVRIQLDGVERVYKPGDVITVEREVRHKFWSDDGVVIEEISSSHYRDDSFYTDPSIAANQHRKTLLTYWMGA